MSRMLSPAASFVWKDLEEISKRPSANGFPLEWRSDIFILITEECDTLVWFLVTFCIDTLRRFKKTGSAIDRQAARIAWPPIGPARCPGHAMERQPFESASHLSFRGYRGDWYCDTLITGFSDFRPTNLHNPSQHPHKPPEPPPHTNLPQPLNHQPPTSPPATLVGSGHKRHKTTPLPCSAKSAKATLFGRQGPKDWVSATCSTKERPTCTLMVLELMAWSWWWHKVYMYKKHMHMAHFKLTILLVNGKWRWDF